MARLDAKIALITGGASGFGETTGRLFVSEGAKVVLTDKNEDGGARVARDIGNAATFLPHDVTSEEDWARVIEETIGLHGKLHILMNNAGVYGTGAPQDIENISFKEWRFINSVNMDGVFLGCRAAIPAIAKSGGGSIINISSIAGIRGTSNIAAYGASKGAVRQLTKTVAQHCGYKGYGIRCNSIHPGMVRTPLGEDVLKHTYGDIEAGAEARLKGVPLGELGTVEDVANAALFLASDESRHITALEMVVEVGLIYAG
jgi:3(or 17)beta-hydroxysteroid dehydrogenase